MSLGYTLVGIAAIISSLTAAYMALSTRRKVEEVATEVKTSNGITLAVLADRAEGRRIETETTLGDRTPSEQHYVDKLQEGGRDL